MEFLERWEKILNQCVEDSRKILTNLRKNVDNNYSFEGFLREKINSYFPFDNLKYCFQTNVEERFIPLRLRKVIFQIIQESVTNVRKHSQANTLKIKIGQYQNMLYLIIKDDGKGFDPNQLSLETKKGRSSYGILGIKERAALNGGEARITSSPGKGTTIKVGLPFHGRKKSFRNQ
ncbi:MAG: two-component system, NarL family, sensor kinase [Candidatus Atribacteria bacterium]|nr:two-component system, NarL family, sensor kinase [Candidatus Atribacteria bacterium]